MTRRACERALGGDADAIPAALHDGRGVDLHVRVASAVDACQVRGSLYAVGEHAGENVAEASNGTHSSATINVIHSATGGVGFREEGPASEERVSLLRMTALVSRTRRFEKVVLT